MSLPAAETVLAPAPPFRPGVSPRRWRLLLAAVLAVYARVQFFYITATPFQTATLPDNMPQGASKTLVVGLGPDEGEHFLYLLSIADGGALPMPDPAHRTPPRQYVTCQAQHPPLFYALAALVYKAASGLPPAAVWFLLRALCTLCGAAVVLVAQASRLCFPDRPFFALAAAPAVAFLPMFWVHDRSPVQRAAGDGLRGCGLAPDRPPGAGAGALLGRLGRGDGRHPGSGRPDAADGPALESRRPAGLRALRPARGPAPCCSCPGWLTASTSSAVPWSALAAG